MHKYVNMYKPGSVHVLDVIIHKPANSWILCKARIINAISTLYAYHLFVGHHN
jgi:hypothetical protein